MDMSWREFQLRRIGYERSQKTDWYKVREISYWVYMSIPTKGKKASKQEFMPIEQKEVIKVSKKDSYGFFKEMQEEYLRNAGVNVGEDGGIEHRDWS
ncbi:hypothetical protein EH151_12605 [Elizabethkingia anophelis]|uniref:hypothetical protein n=1 Tax=Elizabethkingia anophelis TaxID=1117645 RepID=UPI00136C8BEA|nr:hypothetical protein [Elizabethkingia anophelis]MYZ60727.1 hypothetical protein [Elizabethkingia anophelis]